MKTTKQRRLVMHNLGTVFRFELFRALKKKSFWILALTFPVIIGLVFAIIFFSNKATDKAADEARQQKFSLAITDESGLLNPAITSALHAQDARDKEGAIKAVTDGKIDAYFYYPRDLTKNKIEVYGKDVGLFDNSRYQGVAKLILEQSVATQVNPQDAAVLQGNVNYQATTYKDGKAYDGFKELIAPAIFLVLFYLLISMFGNQMLTSTTEEKENRVIEMILTTIQARTLIIGKIFALIVLALIQCLLILVPVLVGYALFHDQLNLPNFDLSSIPFNPERITLGAIIFIFSFLLFTGILVAIGAAAPTAKEAGSFFGIAMIFIFGPLYAVTLFISRPHDPIVTTLSYFPLTAPIPLMLRNAVGNLSVGEAFIGIAILAVSAVIALIVAVRLFRYGALEYSKMLSLKTLFGK